MSELFLRLVNLSISAGYLVLAVLLLRPLMKKAPKWILTALWAVVGLRLVLPVSVESVLSLLPTRETLPPDMVYSPSPAIDSGIPAVDALVNPILGQQLAPEVGASVNPMQILLQAGAILWLLGFLGMGFYFLVSYLRLRHQVSAAVQVQPQVWQSDAIASPFVLGLFRPRIYIPRGLPAGDRDYVLAHERAHIRRRDHWWKPLGFCLLSLYWFQPLLWLAYSLLCRDMELACDERVVKELDPQARADYSQALLSASVGKKHIAACPLAFGEVGVKQRIRSVLHYKKPGFWMVLLAVVLCIAVAMCFLTDPTEFIAPEDLAGSQYRVTEVLYRKESYAGFTQWDSLVLHMDEGLQMEFLSQEITIPKAWYGPMRRRDPAMLSQLAEQSPALQKLLKKTQTLLMARQEIGDGVAESHYLLLTGSDLYYIYGMERGGAPSLELLLGTKRIQSAQMHETPEFVEWIQQVQEDQIKSVTLSVGQDSCRVDARHFAGFAQFLSRARLTEVQISSNVGIGYRPLAELRLTDGKYHEIAIFGRSRILIDGKHYWDENRENDWNFWLLMMENGSLTTESLAGKTLVFQDRICQQDPALQSCNWVRIDPQLRLQLDGDALNMQDLWYPLEAATLPQLSDLPREVKQVLEAAELVLRAEDCWLLTTREGIYLTVIRGEVLQLLVRLCVYP